MRSNTRSRRTSAKCRSPSVAPSGARRASRRLSFSLWLSACAAGCVQDIELARNLVRLDGSPVAAKAGTADAAAAGSGDAVAPDCVPVACRGRLRSCGNCIDDDGDGAIDHMDPECWGPCDGDEAELSSQRLCPSSACFFDPDCGVGNDSACQALVPNGCDCHGCCEVPTRGFAVQLGDTQTASPCTLQTLNDADACERCQLDLGCFNPCDDCELCFAKNQLTGSCETDGGCPQARCSPGQASCGLACSQPCPTGSACVGGCCTAVGP